MLPKSITPGLLVAAVFLFSCVSTKKYQSAVTEAEQLKSQNTELNTQISGLQKQVSDLTTSGKALNQEYAQYKSECEVLQKRMEAQRAALLEEFDTMEKVAERIEAAVEDFADKGVDVYSKDGIVYVSMEENLSYKSGSAKLGDNGKKALGSLAAALNEYPNLKVIVLGHTDDVQFKKGSDNWSLSTERANGVVRILRDEFKVDPSRITSGGKAKYAPIADNSSAEGRAKNRRTEIILNPDMRKIWESAQQK